jgi:polar amino acid transport system substrate-binding protein
MSLRASIRILPIHIVLLAAMTIAFRSNAAQTERILTELLPPFTQLKDGKITGMSTEIVRAVFERAEIPFDIQIMPWQRAFETARTEADTFIFSLGRTPDRENNFTWVGRIVDVKLAIYRLTDRPELMATNLDEVKKNGRIAVISNDASMLRLRQLGFDDSNFFIISDRASGTQLSPLIINRRAEYIISNPFTFVARVKAGELPDAFSKVIDVPSDLGLYLAANLATDPKKLAKLQMIFDAMNRDGTIDKILRSYQ